MHTERKEPENPLKNHPNLSIGTYYSPGNGLVINKKMKFLMIYASGHIGDLQTLITGYLLRNPPQYNLNITVVSGAESNDLEYLRWVEKTCRFHRDHGGIFCFLFGASPSEYSSLGRRDLGRVVEWHCAEPHIRFYFSITKDFMYPNEINVIMENRSKLSDIKSFDNLDDSLSHGIEMLRPKIQNPHNVFANNLHD